MTYFVGIDPASESFVASVYTRPDGPSVSPQSFANASDGFEAFQDWLAEAADVSSSEGALVLVENTGVYSEALSCELHRLGFDLVLLSPRAIWKAFSDERKTDDLDSRKIAEYGYRYQDKLQRWEPHEAVVEQVKTLLSTREQLVKQKTATQNARHALRRKAVQTPPANEVLDGTADHLKAQVEAIEEALHDLISEHPTMAQMTAIARSAPGSGDLLAAHMLVLTEGFSQDPCYRKLASYLGICPHPRQSGTREHTPTSRGYGPSMVRKLLHLAARSVRTHEDKFTRYFHRKRKEGKPKQLVLNNIANKLLRILCGMIKNKQPYISGYQSVHPRLRKAGTRS